MTTVTGETLVGELEQFWVMLCLMSGDINRREENG